MSGTDAIALWAGAVGSWLLVAGPLFQGSLELWEMAKREIPWPDRKPIDRVLWLAPVLLYLVHLTRLRQLHTETADAEAPRTFADRATGWFAVALGGSLVALNETWDVAREYEVSPSSFWVIFFAILFLCQVNVTIRMLRLTRRGSS